MRCLRQMSVTFALASASLRMATIWLSVNRLFFIVWGWWFARKPLLSKCSRTGEAYIWLG